MFERFTDRARRVVVLAQDEARMLNHNYIGTEHILLGLIREGNGVAAQVLVKLGADLNRVRQQVLHLLAGHQAQGPVAARPAVEEHALLPEGQTRLHLVEARLAAIEQRVGTGPYTDDLDDQIDRVSFERHGLADAQKYEQAAALRNREKELLASKAALREQWNAAHPTLPDLAERVQQLADEIERLRALLGQHGIDPQDKPA
jgi:DNA repair exonuclease SbcCD ATPase subunit